MLYRMLYKYIPQLNLYNYKYLTFYNVTKYFILKQHTYILNTIKYKKIFYLKRNFFISPYLNHILPEEEESQRKIPIAVLLTELEFFKQEFLSHEYWEDILKDILSGKLKRHINKDVFESCLMEACANHKKLTLALSYIDFISTKGEKLNFVAQSFLILVMAQNIDKVNDNLFKEYYNNLKSEKLLPCQIICRILHAVSLTKYWEDGFTYLKEINNEENLTRYHTLITESYNNMARALLREKGIDAGITYLQGKYFQQSNKIKTDTWLYIIDLLKAKNSSANYEMYIKKVFDLFMQNKTPLNIDVINSFQKALPENYRAKKVKIYNSKSCQNCKITLNKVKIDGNAVKSLKEACESAIVLREDIFQSTTPEEWAVYQQFINKNGPFDIVIDGLNLILSRNQKNIYYLKKIVSGNKKIFLLLRNHLKNKIRRILGGHLSSNLYIYYVDDYTQDDGFLLYAAFSSGLGTKFISRDYLRNHKFLMKTPYLLDSFENWQKLHQISWYSKEEIYRYDRIPQATNDGRTIHIPFDAPSDEDFYFTNKVNWLCVKKLKK